MTALPLPINEAQGSNSRVSGRPDRLAVPLECSYPDGARFADADGCWPPNAASSASVALHPRVAVGRRRIAPTREQVLLVVDTLGLGKGQLAGIFGVPMRGIYAWLDDSGAMSDEHAKKVRQLAAMLSEVAGETRRPLYHGYVTEPIEPRMDSILDLLRRERWDVERIRSLLRRARADTTERQKRQDRGLRQGSERRDEKTLIDNLVALGAW